MNKNIQETFEVDDELIEEIVDEILNSRKTDKRISTEEALQRHNLGEVIKLKSRISALENRVERYINSFKINTTEVERQISERYENLSNENQQQILSLQGEIEKLRTGMIRLSNEVKRLKEMMGVK